MFVVRGRTHERINAPTAVLECRCRRHCRRLRLRQSLMMWISNSCGYC